MQPFAIYRDRCQFTIQICAGQRNYSTVNNIPTNDKKRSEVHTWYLGMLEPSLLQQFCYKNLKNARDGYASPCPSSCPKVQVKDAASEVAVFSLVLGCTSTRSASTPTACFAPIGRWALFSVASCFLARNEWVYAWATVVYALRGYLVHTFRGHVCLTRCYCNCTDCIYRRSRSPVNHTSLEQATRVPKP